MASTENEISALLTEQLRYFESTDVQSAFELIAVSPREVVREWQYGEPKEHTCWVIGEGTGKDEFLVYCPTGFGPSFPWGRQSKSNRDMGRDDCWFAYLYEAFVTSSLFGGKPPEGFELRGPGEREQP